MEALQNEVVIDTHVSLGFNEEHGYGTILRNLPAEYFA
jgi:hypothetical protein